MPIWSRAPIRSTPCATNKVPVPPAGYFGTTPLFHHCLFSRSNERSKAMTKSRIAVLGSAIAGVALLCGAGFANAQDYRHDYRSYDEHAYYDPVVGETVIVHPD